MVRYRHEFDRRLRVAVVGCGGQAFRNILPAFSYAPVDLIATCDLDANRAESYASQFGARRWYVSLGELLEKEELDAVFLLTGYDEHASPRYPAQVVQVLEAGNHAWMEKPPAACVGDVERMHEASLRTGQQVGVGLMKLFSPGLRKVQEIMRTPEFGRPTTLYLRDPEELPRSSERADPARMVYLLDHLAHPASVIHGVMGPVRRVYVERAANGAAFVLLSFVNGASGVLHMPWGQSGLSPKERLEVVGEGANVVLDNNSSLTYYRPGHPGVGAFEYGRVGDYTGTIDSAPLHWVIDNYSGQPFNMHLFSQGYAPEVLSFCETILSGIPIATGGLADAWHVTRLFEALQHRGPWPLELGEAPAWTLGSVHSTMPEQAAAGASAGEEVGEGHG